VNAIIRPWMLCRSAEIRVHPELDVSIRSAHLDVLDSPMDRRSEGRLSSKTPKGSSSRRQEKRRREIDTPAFGLDPPTSISRANEAFGPGNPGRGSFVRFPASKGRGMSRAPLAKSCRSAISGILFAAVLIAGAPGAYAANGCPSSASEISADRPDVTNSSEVVPYGSLQAENGVDWTNRQGSDVVSGSETRLRLGVAQCTEVLADLPTYFYSLNGRASSGFSDFVVSIKRELPVPFGFHLSATGGLAFPTGASKILSHGYDPYIQFPWSRRLSEDWSLQGMLTVTWFTSQHTGDPTFEPTLSLERELGPRRDLFFEYVGDYPDHARPSQTLDGGGSWRITRLQQFDFHVGFGLNSSSPDHFFGIGYSFRLDALFGGSVGGSP
jgi:hypothetical protein